jgi:glutamine amidotransferase
MKQTIGVIDYGSGNFTSVVNAVSLVSSSVITVKSPKDLSSCTHIVLPGVGAFKTAMSQLEKLNLIDALADEVLIQHKPFLGICVGMQILASEGSEFEQTKGLSWIDTRVEKFQLDQEKFHLPHIGWNEVLAYENNPLFKGINIEDPSFYFVHSYHLQVPADQEVQCTYANYGYPFVAAVQKENIFGVQFHPEKSQKNGLQLLKNFINFNA